jgi:Flp pilus assembly protein TadD
MAWRVTLKRHSVPDALGRLQGCPGSKGCSGYSLDVFHSLVRELGEVGKLTPAGRESLRMTLLVDQQTGTPLDAAIWAAIGHSFYHDNALGLAEKAYRKALHWDPTFVPALEGLGATLAYQGRCVDSIEALTTAHRLHPRRRQIQVDLAHVQAGLRGEPGNPLPCH